LQEYKIGKLANFANFGLLLTLKYKIGKLANIPNLGLLLPCKNTKLANWQIGKKLSNLVQIVIFIYFSEILKNRKNGSSWKRFDQLLIGALF
jgi:hypothetical protein